jgi:hypothetical protein
VALLKTIAVVVAAILVLYALFTVIHFLAATFWTILELAVVVLLVVGVYHYFKRQKAH